MATRIQAAVTKTKSGMTTQVRGLPCLSKSGHGKPRLSYNGHMPKPLSFHIGKALPAGNHLTMARRSGKRRTKPTPYSTMATNSAALGRVSNNIRRKIMEAPKYKTATTGNTARSREWDGGNVALPAMPKPLSLHRGKFLSIRDLGAALP